jgi:hypothetical protein
VGLCLFVPLRFKRLTKGLGLGFGFCNESQSYCICIEDYLRFGNYYYYIVSLVVVGARLKKDYADVGVNKTDIYQMQITITFHRYTPQ